MHQRFRRLLVALSAGLPEREQAVALGLLAVAAGESLFLLGPPGVAKSLVARRLKYIFRDGRSFEYLMGKFSTPEEIFGPLSISGLRDRDVFERKTEGYLPQADVVFLDELWRAGPPIQNTLLAILNEKVFRNGGHEDPVPLKLLVGASNRTPDGEENAEAFWDRFLLRLEILPLSSASTFQQMLSGHDDVYHPHPDPNDQLDSTEWNQLQLTVSEVSVPQAIFDALWDLRVELGKSIYVSDRRWKKALRLLQASAVLHGRQEIDPLDLGVLEHLVWQKPSERETVGATLIKVIEDNGWTPPFNLDQITQQVLALRDNLRGLTQRSQEVTRPKPILHDGEYFALVGYPDQLTARVWAQDWALWNSHEETEGELFFFKPMGAYVKSQKASVRRGEGPAEVFVDGVLYALDSTPEQVTVWSKVVPEGRALQSWKAQSEQVLKKLEDWATELETFTSQQVEVAGQHLFSRGPHVLACRTELDWTAQRLDRAKIALIELLETLNPDAFDEL